MKRGLALKGAIQRSLIVPFTMRMYFRDMERFDSFIKQTDAVFDAEVLIVPKNVRVHDGVKLETFQSGRYGEESNSKFSIREFNKKMLLSHSWLLFSETCKL